MKRNLALILAIVMLLGSLFGVMSMAEATEGTTPPAEETPAVRYVPEIAYANLSYADKMYMMFAVPAPAALEEGAAVKLIVWESREESLAFSYNDIIKEVVDAEAETINIGGVDHLVFKYDKLTASDMTNVICARPVVVKNDTATAYGKLVEYSVLEYVAAAKGEFNGIAGIEDQDHLAVLDSLLDFGSLAQQFSTDEYAYMANDELHKIFVTPVINGIKKATIFGGFFKYDAESAIDFLAPFYDGTEIISIEYADGSAVVDLEEDTDGIQFIPADADIELVVEYQNISVRALCADDLGPDLVANNYGEVTGGHPGVVKKDGFWITLGSDTRSNISGNASVADSYGRMNYWHGYKTVTDPDDPEGLVLQVTATGAPTLQFNNTTAANWAGYGFGDTIYPAFTFEMTLGSVNGKMPTTGNYYFRHRPGTQYYQYGVDLVIYSIKNGEVTLPNGTVIGTIPETGMAKFAITVDALTNVVYGYCENIDGEMELTATSEMVLNEKFLDMQQRHFANLADEDPSNDTQFLTYESIYTFFTKSNLEPTWVVGSGAATNPAFEALKTGEGIYDMEAVQNLAESEYSFLLDDYKLTIGAIYD